MKFKGISLLVFLLIYMPFSARSQFAGNMGYSVESGVTLGKGDYSPFWLTSNKYGLSSISTRNGYVRAGIFRPLEEDRKFSYSFGLDLAGAYHFTSNFIVQQAYLDLKYGILNLSMGSKERDTELKNQQLSSGGMTFSRNARPVPQIRAGLPDYWIVPGSNQWLAVRGHIAFGAFTDDKWQENFIQKKNRYTQDALYHSKSFFMRLGNEDKRPLVFEGGIEMASQFRGKVYNRGFDPYLDMRNGLMDFVKVLIPSGSDPTDGEYANVYGNHLGNWNFSLSYKFPGWKARAYYDHYFDDHSMLFFEHAWIDALAGLEITLPSNPIVGSIVYEHVGTKDQAGPIYHDHTVAIPDQISARDNYYNHGLYSGWQHWGMAIGNPLLVSPIYNTDGSIVFKSNRIIAHHLGFSGQPASEVNYRVLFSYTQGWGTYVDPFVDIKKNTAVLLELGYAPRALQGWQFTASIAFDRGDLIGNNTGGMILVRKTGLFTK
ncbi:MAG: capsule assembly Wzi family protein [Tannerellaceae bacterium]|nr:capsule assembly Wzi family protein [Tannerellaceae bacterium]